MAPSTLSSVPLTNPDQVTIPVHSGESFLRFLMQVKHMQLYLILFPSFLLYKISMLHVDLCLSYLYFMSPGGISLSVLQSIPLALHHRLLIHTLKTNTWLIFNLFCLIFEFDLEWELDLCQTALIRRR